METIQMNADSFFTIGSTHQVCEDYSLSGGKDDNSFAVMSDGCSGSPRTDFGARFLSLAMEQILQQKTLNKEEMHNVGLSIAKLMSTTTGLPLACLDATLGYVFADGDHIRAFMAGDGAIAARKKDGSKWCAIIEYPSGAPPYISYSLDDDRTELYLNATNGCQFKIDMYESSTDLASGYTSTIEDEGMHSHVFRFPRDEYDLVMVMSDGVSSFQKPKNSETTKYFEEVHAAEIIDRILAVKSAKGDFIKRRCKRVIKNLCLKAGWKHLDDFSVAALYGGE